MKLHIAATAFISSLAMNIALAEADPLAAFKPLSATCPSRTAPLELVVVGQTVGSTERVRVIYRRGTAVQISSEVRQPGSVYELAFSSALPASGSSAGYANYLLEIANSAVLHACTGTAEQRRAFQARMLANRQRYGAPP
jgi:hypothetical protein